MKNKYLFSMWAFNRPLADKRDHTVVLLLKAESEKDAIQKARQLTKRKFYEIHRVEEI